MNKNDACVCFLQWALPRLHMRWPGFRKVRRQVCKRIYQRIKELQLPDIIAYKRYLLNHPTEWHLLDRLCRVTISRFYREHGVFQHLSSVIIPQLADQIRKNKRNKIRCWSAGCASGEEPYTLALLGNHVLSAFPEIEMEIIATDIDSVVLARAEKGCYPSSSIKELPAALFKGGFEKRAGCFCLQVDIRKNVHFFEQDIRKLVPEGMFHLVLCRYLVFTYYDISRQKSILDKIDAVLHPGGILVIGNHETLPDDQGKFPRCSPGLPIYRKQIA